MLFRTLLSSFGLMCAMTGTMMSETIEKGKPFPLKNAELKTEGIRFAQPAMNNALISTGIAGKPVMAQKSNNFVDKGKKVRSTQTSTTPFMKTTNTLPGILLGVTYYDLQSNGSMPHRISYFEEGNDKSAQVIWMGASDMERFNPPHPTRGSYYALVDMADPLNPEKYTDVEWNRIEGTIRSGFPSIVQYKDGSVGSIAHVISSESSASAMRITKNTSFGDIAFTSKQIPGADSSLWGHATVDGDDVTHLAFTSDTSSKNFGEQVVYMRSTDKGNTWSEPKIMTGPLSSPQLPTGRGANSYQFATRGSTVALAYQDSTFNLRVIKSEDNGETWGQPINVFGGSRHATAYMVEDYGDGTFRATTDTVPICGPSFDIVLNQDGFIHGMASTTPSWNIGTARMNDNGEIEFIDDTTYASIYTRVQGVYFNEEANTYGLTTMAEDWDGQGTVVTRPFGSGLCRHFKLGVDDADNSLYMVYTGIKNGDVFETILADGNADFGLQGHIYVSKRFNGAEMWEPEIDLTPVEYDCQFPSMYQRVKDGIVMMAYQADRTPGVSIQNSNQDVEENFVHFHAFRPAFVSVDEQVGQNSEFMIAPNPATDLVTISFGKQDQAVSVTISDALGQTVAEMPAELSTEGSVMLSTSSFATGTYFCTIRSANGTASKMFSIVR
ncbi:MAG: T9SS type A sorting domain-containing protein [Candidatus Kapaibacteriota bacterium]